jgi:hypothetical protein
VFCMKAYILFISAILLTSLSAGVANAQDSDSADKYHPFLSDTFHISLGAFRPKKDIALGLSNGSEFTQEIAKTETESTPAITFRWRYTKNWSLWGQYWDVGSEASAVLDEDIEFADGTLLAGSTISTKIETSVLRLFFGRSFFKKPQSEWGAGAGLHWMESKVSLRLDADTSPPNLDWNVNETRTAKAGVPLPNLGAWYMFSWSPKWVTTARLDWLDITVDEYSGTMFNASAGVNYQFSRHVGVGLAMNAFKLEAEQKEPGKNLKLESRQWGPFLSLTANW